MTHYHAVLLDETGCEFGASTEASSRSAAYDYFREAYPESRVVQLEDPEDTSRRERAMYQRLLAEEEDFYDEEEDVYVEEDFYDEEEDDEDDPEFDDFTDEERNERHQRWAEAEEDD